MLGCYKVSPHSQAQNDPTVNYEIDQMSNAQATTMLDAWNAEIQLQKDALKKPSPASNGTEEMEVVPPPVLHVPAAIVTPEVPVIVLPKVLPTIDDTIAKFSLNVKQELVVRIVLEHFHSVREGLSPPQLKTAVLGEPGVGKSVVVTAIAWHFEQYDALSELMITAFTGMYVYFYFYST